MNFLGYLVTLANLQNFRGNSPNDISIRVGTLGTIAEELQRLPGITLEGFRENGYQKVGPVGVYISKNVQNFLFYNTGKANDEGLMLTLFFSTTPDSTQSVGGLGDSNRQTLFVRRQPEIPDGIRKIIKQYAQTGEWTGQAASK